MRDCYIECQVALKLLDGKLAQLRSLVEQFPEDRIWQRPRPGIVSLGNLVCHVAGSMRDWIENGVAQRGWTRDRRNEFEREGGFDRDGLIKHLEETRAHCESLLAVLDQEQWAVSTGSLCCVG